MNPFWIIGVFAAVAVVVVFCVFAEPYENEQKYFKEHEKPTARARLARRMRRNRR